jgi:hypothetical protein
VLRLNRDDVRRLIQRGHAIDVPHALQLQLSLPESRGRTKSGRRADLDGLYVRSSWEANRLRWLNRMVESGLIQAWIYEPRVFAFRGITRGCREYKPDVLVIHTDGRHTYEEIKGQMDQKSKTRLARMKKYYPAIVLEVIGREWFVEMERSGVSATVPHWEYL